MNPTHSAVFDALKAAGPTRADSLARITMLTRLLDSAFLIPGTNRRVGLDAVIGLVPCIGDAISTALASYIIWEARQLGLPRWKIARMIGNVAVDTAVGAVPFAGDVFDVFFKANERNLRIIHKHLGQARPAGDRGHGGEAGRGDPIPSASDGAQRRTEGPPDSAVPSSAAARFRGSGLTAVPARMTGRRVHHLWLEMNCLKRSDLRRSENLAPARPPPRRRPCGGTPRGSTRRARSPSRA